MKTRCPHLDFAARVDVARIVPELDPEDEGRPPSPADEVVALRASVRIACADCGESIGFRCPDVGDLPDRPAVSPDALELRLPLVSPSELVLLGPLAAMRGDGLPGFSAHLRDAPPTADHPTELPSCCAGEGYPGIAHDLNEARCEVERLRCDLAAEEHATRDLQAGQMKAMREVERLREALRHLFEDVDEIMAEKPRLHELQQRIGAVFLGYGGGYNHEDDLRAALAADAGSEPAS